MTCDQEPSTRLTRRRALGGLVVRSGPPPEWLEQRHKRLP